MPKDRLDYCLSRSLFLSSDKNLKYNVHILWRREEKNSFWTFSVGGRCEAIVLQQEHRFCRLKRIQIKQKHFFFPQSSLILTKCSIVKMLNWKSCYATKRMMWLCELQRAQTKRNVRLTPLFGCNNSNESLACGNVSHLYFMHSFHMHPVKKIEYFVWDLVIYLFAARRIILIWCVSGGMESNFSFFFS